MTEVRVVARRRALLLDAEAEHVVERLRALATGPAARAADRIERGCSPGQLPVQLDQSDQPPHLEGRAVFDVVSAWLDGDPDLPPDTRERLMILRWAVSPD